MQGSKALVARGLVAGALAALVACTLYFFGAFEAVEYQLYDRNFRSSWQGDAPPEIVIVAVDQPSLRRLGSWPWPRMYHAEAIRQIHDNGARVIGVDIGFLEPDRRDPENDRLLVEATREAGNVVYPVIMERIIENDQPRLLRLEPIPELAEAATLGHAHVDQGSDGIVRKVYLAYKTPERTYWGMNVEILRIYLGLPEDSIRVLKEGALGIGEIEVPVIQAPSWVQVQEGIVVTDYEMHIGYVGDRDTFTYVPAHEVIEGNIPPNSFAGKIVLYGGTSAGLFDSHMTPFSQDRSPMPGVEIQANVVNAMLHQRYLTRAPLWLLALVTALSAMAVAVIYQYFDFKFAAFLMLLLLGATFAMHTYLFNAHGFWIEVSPTVVALVIAFILGLMMKMRLVNVALDAEVLNLSEAAALTDRAGDKSAVATFKAAEPTLRDVLNVSAAALLKVDRNKGVLIPTAQYGLGRPSPNQRTGIKLTGELTGLLATFDPLEIDSLGQHPLGVIVPRADLARYHARVVPLLAKGGTVGALALFRAKGETFREAEHDLLQAISKELGNIWYNATLYDRLTTKTRNPFASFTYKNQERRIQTLNVLSDAVLDEKSLMASIMDSIADGVIVTDVLGTIRLLNPAARQILGLYAESAIGQSAVDFIKRFADVPFEAMHDGFKKIVERGETITTDIKLSLPTTRFYSLSLGPVRSGDGLVQGIVAVLSDITELKEMDQMKTDLMSMVTHEIRTPLATVRGFAQILLKGGIGSDKSREFLGIINRQSNRLVNLVNDFLDITRIESGRQVITKGPVDLTKLIQSAVSDLRPLADEKSISIQFAPAAAGFPEIFGDRNLIEQVLINLISNAIKYSPKGAWARIGLSQQNGHLSVAIQDNGLGIPKEALPRLFEKFYRVRCDDRKDIIGTGLGLSLVKQIIDVHQGTIRVESEHGQGSTFTFTVPIHREGVSPVTATTSSILESMAASN